MLEEEAPEHLRVDLRLLQVGSRELALLLGGAVVLRALQEEGWVAVVEGARAVVVAGNDQFGWVVAVASLSEAG